MSCRSVTDSKQHVSIREVEDLKADVLRAVAQQRRSGREAAIEAKRRLLVAVEALEESVRRVVNLHAPRLA